MKNYNIYYKDKTDDEFLNCFLEACKSNNKELINYLWNENNNWKQVASCNYLFICLKNLVIEDSSCLNILFKNPHLLFSFLSKEQKSSLFKLAISFENWNNLEILEKNTSLALIDKIFLIFDYINHSNYNFLQNFWNVKIENHVNDIIHLHSTNIDYKLNYEILSFLKINYSNNLSEINKNYLIYNLKENYSF